MSAQRNPENHNDDWRMEWLLLDALEYEPSIQRPLDQRAVDKIAATFDPDQFGIPLVAALPLGRGRYRYVVVDGWTRINAARKALGDGQKVLCQIRDHLSLAQAAAMFRGRNSARPVRTVDKFLVGITAGDEECLAIAAAVESYGLRIGRVTADGIVTAVVSLQWVYRGEKSRGNGKNLIPLKRTLDIVTQAWGKSAASLMGDVMKGIGAVILRYGDQIDYDALIHKLRQFKGGAAGLLGAGRGAREWAAGSVSNGVAAVVVREYNKGRKHKLPDWMRGQDDA